jgi:D-cysteine desulfhydrase
MADLNQKFNLGFFPTPLQPLHNLSKKYKGFQLFIKRDDHTGLASGGNKTRKLEYLIQDALDQGCDTILTAGAQQSNHCRQTASACAIAGLKCHLLLGGTEPKQFDGNLLLSHLLGAQIHFTGDNRKGEDLENIKSALESKGKKCYVIPYGGSNLTGALGFVNAVGELKQQLQTENLQLDYIFFASSSGGMQAGLMLGIELFELNVKLIPISIDKEEINGQSIQEIVLSLVKEGVKLLELKKDFQLQDIPLNCNYDKDGYGNVTEKERFAIKELAQNEGIILDPVYTGRAFYGMLDCLKNHQLKPNAKVLFWHSGGFPATFYYGNQLK